MSFRSYIIVERLQVIKPVAGILQPRVVSNKNPKNDLVELSIKNQLDDLVKTLINNQDINM